MTITAFFDCDFPWQDIAEAPGETRVLVCGGGPVRFGYKDPLGNWRATHHGPIKGTPRFWMPIPRPAKEGTP